MSNYYTIIGIIIIILYLLHYPISYIIILLCSNAIYTFIILIRFSTFINTFINSITTIINITKNKKKRTLHRRIRHIILLCLRMLYSYYKQRAPAIHVGNFSNDIGYYIIVLLLEKKKKHLNRMKIFILFPRPARCGNSKPSLMKLFRHARIHNTDNADNICIL